MIVPSPPAAVDEALARAVVYQTLSLGFQAPTEERLSVMGAPNGCPIVGAALRSLATASTRERFDEAAGALAAMAMPGVERLAASFVRLFGHTGRGPVCACETEYGPDNPFHQPQQLADIAGYYLAFGLQPTALSEARVDHIACELEFMDFLSRKQALWLADGSDTSDALEILDITERAARTFLRDHLARFGRAFAIRVVAEDPDGYLGVLGRLLLAFLEAECVRVGVAAGPVDLAVRPDVVDDTPMACGRADDLIQIQRKA